MNNAQKIFDELMQNDEFKTAYFSEKIKLDLEFALDELDEGINSEKPKAEIIRRSHKLRKILENA